MFAEFLRIRDDTRLGPGAQPDKCQEVTRSDNYHSLVSAGSRKYVRDRNMSVYSPSEAALATAAS